MKRVITGGICHETSTFTPVKTTLESYQERFLVRGRAMLDLFRNTNTPIGGFIDGADKHGFELIPTLFAEPHTSAPTPRPLFDTLVNELLEGIANAGPIDGGRQRLVASSDCTGPAKWHSIRVKGRAA